MDVMVSEVRTADRCDAAVRGRKSRFRMEMLWVMCKPGHYGEWRTLGSDRKEGKISADAVTAELRLWGRGAGTTGL